MKLSKTITATQKNKDIPAENLDPEDFTFIDENNDFKLKFIFNSFYGITKKTNPEDINIRNLDFYLLINILQRWYFFTIFSDST